MLSISIDLIRSLAPIEDVSDEEVADIPYRNGPEANGKDDRDFHDSRDEGDEEEEDEDEDEEEGLLVAHCGRLIDTCL